MGIFICQQKQKKIVCNTYNVQHKPSASSKLSLHHNIMKYFYFTVVFFTAILVGCKKEEEQINDLCLYKLESTLITNDSLQQELLKMQEEIDLLQEKLEIARQLTEVE